MTARSRFLSICTRRRFLFTLLIVSGCLAAQGVLAATPQFVVDISVDGLGSYYLRPLVERNRLPNFKRFQAEGAGTLNARNDDNVTVTLPNHTTMMTGRSVLGPGGHHWTANTDPPKGKTLHSNLGSYIASVFDVAHDHGLRTALYSGKHKFSLYAISYDAAHGAPDANVPGHGRNKIDTFVYDKDLASMTRQWVAAMREKPFQFSFIHYADPDSAGHLGGWGGDGYNRAIEQVDVQLGVIFQLIESDPRFQGKTTILLSADHGGKNRNHANPLEVETYTIPFCVWGCGVSRGADLYALNKETRRDPGTAHPLHTDPQQPIRNGDGANLSLKLLGLGPVPGSTINTRQDLAVEGQAAPETKKGSQ